MRTNCASTHSTLTGAAYSVFRKVNKYVPSFRLCSVDFCFLRLSVNYPPSSSRPTRSPATNKTEQIKWADDSNHSKDSCFVQCSGPPSSHLPQWSKSIPEAHIRMSSLVSMPRPSGRVIRHFCSRGKTITWSGCRPLTTRPQPSPPRRDPAWSPNKAASSSQHSPAQTVSSLPCCSSLSCWKDGPARRCPVKEWYARL